jgi:hypothetical protein
MYLACRHILEWGETAWQVVLAHPIEQRPAGRLSVLRSQLPHFTESSIVSLFIVVRDVGCTLCSLEE